MSPGPAKSFDPAIALEAARDLFWRKGYGAVGISEIERELGIGRKSLYDTFGNKRELYLKALEHYAATVIERICRGLSDARNSAMENLERVLERLQQHHGSADSHGCLLGVAMAQAESDDGEVAAVIDGYLKHLERAFERTIETALDDGDLRPDVIPRDLARHLVALTQGMALLGRVSSDPEMQCSITRAALHAVRAPS